jgi:hypothetical protein
VVEAPRRHGPFDTRWPCGRKNNSRARSATRLLSPAEAAEALDWEAFSKRYFPGRRRHDTEALTAYASYTQGREWRTAPERLSVVPTEHVPAAVEFEWHEAGTRRLLAALAAERT